VERVGQQIVAAEQANLVAEAHVVVAGGFRKHFWVYIYETVVHQVASADHFRDLGQRPLTAQNARLVFVRRALHVYVTGRLGHE